MIAILQPFIPHYREEFIRSVTQEYKSDIYIYEKDKKIKSDKYNSAKLYTRQLKSLAFGGFLLYNPLIFLNRNYSALVLMLHVGHISTWMLLLTKCLHRKKIILWGHGISVKRYAEEEKEVDWRLKLMIRLADMIWLYTKKEKDIWQSVFPQKKIVALNNTISGIENILQNPLLDKQDLKQKYGIKQRVIFIFCARFSSQYRRTDLLINLIEKLDPSEFAFIIIGDGKLKPNFSEYSNVYDFGSVYDDVLKDELFQAADIYFQPAWLGLSVVEAMAYGKPIFTFERDGNIKQGVEYNYIEDGITGYISKDIETLIEKINTISSDEIQAMSVNAKDYVAEQLSMQNMARNAIESLKSLEK